MDCRKWHTSRRNKTKNAVKLKGSVSTQCSIVFLAIGCSKLKRAPESHEETWLKKISKTRFLLLSIPRGFKPYKYCRTISSVVLFHQTSSFTSRQLLECPPVCYLPSNQINSAHHPTIVLFFFFLSWCSLTSFYFLNKSRISSSTIYHVSSTISFAIWKMLLANSWDLNSSQIIEWKQSCIDLKSTKKNIIQPIIPSSFSSCLRHLKKKTGLPQLRNRWLIFVSENITWNKKSSKKKPTITPRRSASNPKKLQLWTLPGAKPRHRGGHPQQRPVIFGGEA